MQVVILAGGVGTRLRPLTARVPKSLIPVAGRPFIDYQLELLAAHHVTEIVLCTGYLGEQIEAHCGSGVRYGVTISYSHDGVAPLGTGGALRKAAPLLHDEFFVMYGDSYLPCAYQDMAAFFKASGALGVMTVYENHDRYGRSNVVVEDGRVVVYDKEQRMPTMSFIDYGLSLFAHSALALLPAHGPHDLSVLHQALIQQRQLLAYTVPTRFYEVGSPAGLQEFTMLVQLGALTKVAATR